MGKELVVLSHKNLPGTAEVPSDGAAEAAFVLSLVRWSDLHRGEQLDRPLQKRTRKSRKVGPAQSGLQGSWEDRATHSMAKA
jgi:hypothetical protein